MIFYSVRVRYCYDSCSICHQIYKLFIIVTFSEIDIIPLLQWAQHILYIIYAVFRLHNIKNKKQIILFPDLLVTLLLLDVATILWQPWFVINWRVLGKTICKLKLSHNFRFSKNQLTLRTCVCRLGWRWYISSHDKQKFCWEHLSQCTTGTDEPHRSHLWPSPRGLPCNTLGIWADR